MQSGPPRRAPPASSEGHTGRKRNIQNQFNPDYRSKYHTESPPSSQQQRPIIIERKYYFQTVVSSPQYRLPGNLSRIKFCFQNPYNLQIRYMQHILKCLDENKNALIQSPTGSGKTLCLLSSVLGWVHYDNTKKKQNNAHFSQFTNKIIYLSKTHSQLAQVGQQLKQTCYRPTMVVLGSKQKLCIHPEVMNISDSGEQNRKCNESIRKKILLQQINALTPQKFAQLGLQQRQYKDLIKGSCDFYKQYQVRKKKYKKVFKELEGEVVSIEDERYHNRQHEVCPYFYPNSAKFFSNLVLMPYNYLTSARILKRYSSIVQKSIIIFDQGHNILQSMCQGASIQYRQNIFENIIKQLQKIIKQFDKKKKGIPKQKLTFDAEDVESRRALQEQRKKKKKEIQSAEKIRQMLVDMVKELKKIHTNFYTYCLNKAKIIKNIKQKFQDDDKEIKQCLSNNNVRREFLYAFFDKDSDDMEECIKKLTSYSFNLQAIYSYLYEQSGKKFGPFSLISLSENFQQIVDILKNQQRLQHYALFMHYEKLWKIQQEQWVIKMNLHCFSPKYMLQKLYNQSPKSIIITSGTLSPLPSWKISTGLGDSLLDFSNNNDHVINQDQTKTVLVSSIEKSPLHIITTTNVQQSIKNAYKTIKIICQNTPHGVLVVVGSKSWQKKFQKYHGQVDASQIIKKKQIFFETNQNPRQITSFLQKYERAANSPEGSVLFLICRGKLSEGIDFKDNMARAVVMIGIPLKNFRDPYVKEHKQYCQRQKKKNPNHQSGNDWQRQEVIRAINQSIGRVIRNSKDFGMIFLVDQRYCEKWNSEYCFGRNLSGWALKQVSERYIDATQIPDMCTQFFNTQRRQGRM